MLSKNAFKKLTSVEYIKHILPISAAHIQAKAANIIPCLSLILAFSGKNCLNKKPIEIERIPDIRYPP
jgi:hypothetical protein